MRTRRKHSCAQLGGEGAVITLSNLKTAKYSHEIRKYSKDGPTNQCAELNHSVHN